MKNKERKNLAKKIAKAQYAFDHSEDPETVEKAKQEILILNKQIMDNCRDEMDYLENISAIDELVQELLSDMS